MSIVSTWYAHWLHGRAQLFFFLLTIPLRELRVFELPHVFYILIDYKPISTYQTYRPLLNAIGFSWIKPLLHEERKCESAIFDWICLWFIESNSSFIGLSFQLISFSIKLIGKMNWNVSNNDGWRQFLLYLLKCLDEFGFTSKMIYFFNKNVRLNDTSFSLSLKHTHSQNRAYYSKNCVNN